MTQIKVRATECTGNCTTCKYYAKEITVCGAKYRNYCEVRNLDDFAYNYTVCNCYEEKEV